MNEIAKKAYEAYKRTAKMNYVQVTTAKLNVIYNIQCRMNRDEEYRQTLLNFETEEGKTIAELIENYFIGYNARHGLEIRDNLIEFENPDFADGGYFIVESYRLSNGEPVSCNPTSYAVGDTAHISATLYCHSCNGIFPQDHITNRFRIFHGSIPIFHYKRFVFLAPL